MATNPPKTGYQIEVVAMKCFLAILQSDQWFNLAIRSGGSDPKGILDNLAIYAIIAAASIESQLAANETVY